MTPSDRCEFDIVAFIEHGVYTPSRVSAAVRDGIIEGLMTYYLRWHEAVWA